MTTVWWILLATVAIPLCGFVLAAAVLRLAKLIAFGWYAGRANWRRAERRRRRRKP